MPNGYAQQSPELLYGDHTDNAMEFLWQGRKILVCPFGVRTTTRLTTPLHSFSTSSNIRVLTNKLHLVGNFCAQRG